MNRPGTPLPAWLRGHHREATRPLQPAPAAGALGASRAHCWLQGPDEASGWWPALLVQWRRDGESWVAQVAYVAAAEGPPVLVVAWVAAEQLRPA